MMASLIMVLAVVDLTAVVPPAAAMLWPALAAGAVVGLALGLTGGGGAIFAVPLLVYWIGIEPRTAVTVSLVTVAVTAFVGAAERWCRGQVEPRTGLLFAAAGVLTTPLGGWLGDRLPAPALLAAFAVLMLVIAVRMWRKAGDSAERAAACVFAGGVGPTCSRDADGRLRMTTRCVVQLTFVGLVVGLLSGLFGVGGGFLIVPALVAFATMDVLRAVGTSLFVMAVVGTAAVTAQLVSGREIPLDVVGGFVAGSVPALFSGSWLGRRLGGPALARVFAAAIVGVAVFIIARTLGGG